MTASIVVNALIAFRLANCTFVNVMRRVLMELIKLRKSVMVIRTETVELYGANANVGPVVVGAASAEPYCAEKPACEEKPPPET